MGIRRRIADKIVTIAHRNPEPPPGPDAEAAPGGRAAGTGTAIAASRDAAQREDAGRQAWFQYLDGQQPANDAEARWFQTFREGERRARARYSEERTFALIAHMVEHRLDRALVGPEMQSPILVGIADATNIPRRHRACKELRR